MRSIVVISALAVVLAGCGSGDGGETRATCSIAGTRSFELVHLDGPAMDRTEFAQTRQGQALDAFFVGGEGAPEGGPYVEADGFTVISDDYVIAFRGTQLISDFVLRSGGVSQWGGCSPVLVRGDLVAARWYLDGARDEAATAIPIRVQGGACVEPDETEVVTEVVDVEVLEGEVISVIAWTRDIGGDRMCAGVGVEIEAEALLATPLGSRPLVDGGTVPPAAVSP